MLPFSQCAAVNPGRQEQEYEFKPSLQVPPCWQMTFMQSSISKMKKDSSTETIGLIFYIIVFVLWCLVVQKTSRRATNSVVINKPFRKLFSAKCKLGYLYSI
jgi:hypothetical protein